VDHGSGWLSAKNIRPYLKNTLKAKGMVQVTECLPNKCKAQSSNSQYHPPPPPKNTYWSSQWNPFWFCLVDQPKKKEKLVRDFSLLRAFFKFPPFRNKRTNEISEVVHSCSVGSYHYKKLQEAIKNEKICTLALAVP
jgi:hypothetical protein